MLYEHCRLAPLKQLKILNLSENFFEKGLPPVVAELTSLESLILVDCHLSSLPSRYTILQNWRALRNVASEEEVEHLP